MQRPAEELKAEILRLEKQTEEIQAQARQQYELVPTERDINWSEELAVQQCRRNMVEMEKLRWVLWSKPTDEGSSSASTLGPVVLPRADLLKLLTSLRLVGDIEKFSPVLGELHKRRLVCEVRQAGTFDQIKWVPLDKKESGWDQQTTGDLMTLFVHLIKAQQRFI